MMKKVITRMLAFAALMLCGGAWASAFNTQVYWNDGMSFGTKNGFTLTTEGGCDIANNAAIIEKSSTSSNAGVKITWDSQTTVSGNLIVFVKYSGLQLDDTNFAPLLSVYWQGNNNEVDVLAKSGSVNCAYGVTSSGAGNQQTAGNVDTIPSEGMMAVAFFGSNAGDKGKGAYVAFAAKKTDGTYEKFSNAQRWSSVTYSDSAFYAIKIGGSLTGSSSYKNAGMKIEGIAVSNSKTGCTLNGTSYMFPNDGVSFDSGSSNIGGSNAKASVVTCPAVTLDMVKKGYVTALMSSDSSAFGGAVMGNYTFDAGSSTSYSTQMQIDESDWRKAVVITLEKTASGITAYRAGAHYGNGSGMDIGTDATSVWNNHNGGYQCHNLVIDLPFTHEAIVAEDGTVTWNPAAPTDWSTAVVSVKGSGVATFDTTTAPAIINVEEGAAAKFTALNSAPFATGDGEVQIMASNVTSGFTVTAGSKVTLVGGVDSAVAVTGLVTINGTLQTRGKVTLGTNTQAQKPLLAATGTFVALDGEVNWNVYAANMFGSMNVMEDAKVTLQNWNGGDISSDFVLNVYGELCVNVRLSSTGSSSKKYTFYAGSKISGTGDQHGALDICSNNATYFFEKNPRHPEYTTVTITAPWRLRSYNVSNHVADVAEGVIVDVQGNFGYNTNSDTAAGNLVKNGLGTIKFTGAAAKNASGTITVNAGKVLCAVKPTSGAISVKNGAYFGMTTETSPITSNITVEEGGAITFPANWAADTAYTLTTGTVTASDANGVTTYVGDAAQIVNLDYEGATVKYTLVRAAGDVYLVHTSSGAAFTYVTSEGTTTSLIDGDTVNVDRDTGHYTTDLWGGGLNLTSLAKHTVKIGGEMDLGGTGGIPAGQNIEINYSASGNKGIYLYNGIGDGANVGGTGALYFGYGPNQTKVPSHLGNNVTISCTTGFADSGRVAIIEGAVTITGTIVTSDGSEFKIAEGGSLTVSATANVGTINSYVPGMLVRRTENGDTAMYDVVAPVVKTVIDGTTTYYATLQEALAAIGSGDITNVIILDDSIDTEPYGVEDGHLVAPVAQIDETQYSTFAKAFAAAQEAGATAENPTEVTALRSIASAVEIPEYAVVFATFANRITGALSGSGTYKIINTPSMTTSDSWDKTIDNWFGAGSLTSFNGTLWMARGRFKITESIESGRVALKVTDGAQFYVTSGTISNPIEISGNGMTFESNDTKYQAVRLDGATYSGKITAVVTGDEENKIVPRIGTHNNTGAIITGDIIAPDGIKLQSTLAAGVITISTIKGSATDTSVACAVEKVGAGEVKVKNIGKGDIKITSGTFRLNEAKVAANVNFEIASGAKLNCYGWPTFAGAWSIKTDATIDGVLDNTGNNPACIRTGAFTKKGTGTITMPLLFGNGDGDYTGSITVEDGELIIGKNSTFDSTATITVEDGAALSVANGITVSGNAAISVADEGTIKGYGTSTLSGALTVENGSKIEVGADATLTINGSFTSESEVTIEKIGDGKLILGADTTATNVSIKLSAGTIAMPSSLEVVPEMADGKTGFVTTVDGVTTYIPFTTPSLENPTTVWERGSNSYLSKNASAPTPIFVSTTSLEDIASGNAKLIGKIKGEWVTNERDLAIAKRDGYTYVEGSNIYEIQCQMYDGKNADKSDYYTKVQNVTLYQIKDGDNYYIFATGSQGYYLGDGTDRRGTYIEKTATGVRTDTVADSYEVIKIEIDQTSEGSYNGKNYASIIAAIAAAEADPGHGAVTLQANTAANIVVPSGVVLELNNHTISGQVRVEFGGWITENDVVKIDGFTTSFDIAYEDKITLDYQQESKAISNIGAGEASYFQGDTHNTLHGIYLKHQPKISSVPASFFTSTEQLTMAVIGTMPSAQNSIFAHMGSAANNKNGIFLASGEKANEVVVAYNKGTTATVIARMTVPNAATARHLYIITKSDTDTKASFTVYLDGDEFTTQTFDKFIIDGGYQLGGTFSQTVTGFNAVADDSTAYVNVFRAYDRVISAAEIERYKEVYQYTSLDGNYERTFEAGTTDWSSENAWTRTDGEEHTYVDMPTAGMVSTTFAGDTTVTVNGTAANLYEKLTIAGTGTITFEKGEGDEVKALTPVATQIMTPIVINEGSLDLAGGPTKVGEHGSVTFDFTSLTAKAVANGGGLMLKVTGITDADVDMTKFSVVKNDAESRLSVQVVRNADDGCVYVKATVAPIDIYYISGYMGVTDREGEGGVFQYEDESAATIDDILAGDNVIIGSRTSVAASWIASSFPTKKLSVKKNYTLNAGETATYFDGGEITIDDGVSLTLANDNTPSYAHQYTLGAVTFNAASENGTGTVKINSTMTSGAITGTAAVEIAEGATLTPSSIANTVKGSGTLQLVGAGMTSETAVHVPTISGLTADTWTGTFELKNWNGTINNPIFKLADYGHRNSSIVLDGYKGYVYYDDEDTHAFKSIEIKGEGVVFNGSYSAGPAITFVADKIIGSGKIDCQVAGGNGTMKFVGDASDFTGAVTANTKYRVVFVGSSNTTIPDFTGKTIVIASDVSHGIASGTTWSADGGVVVAGTVTGEGTITGPIKLVAANAKATVASVSGNVTSMVDDYTLVLNEVGSLKTYSLVQNGGTVPEVVIPEGTTEVSLAPGQSATFTGDAPTTITVKIANAAGGAAYDVTDYCTVTTDNGTITTTLKDDQTTKPTVTTMATPTEGEGQSATDKVQFTITNPIPGLFYSIVSADGPTDSDFADQTAVDSDGTQATNSTSTTTAIDMPTNAKVKYFRVRVKATK